MQYEAMNDKLEQLCSIWRHFKDFDSSYHGKFHVQVLLFLTLQSVDPFSMQKFCFQKKTHKGTRDMF